MKILLADDHDLVRETIASFISTVCEATVTTVGSVAEALTSVKTEGPFDLIMLDYRMPGMNGLEGLRTMLDATKRSCPVAVLSGKATRALAEEAIAEGAAGFVPKTIGSKSMITAVRFMAEGEIYAPFSIMQQKEEYPSDILTNREFDVLQGICKGLSNKEIARDYEIVEATVKLHAQSVCRKLGAKNRTHAAMIARDMNLV